MAHFDIILIQRRDVKREFYVSLLCYNLEGFQLSIILCRKRINENKFVNVSTGTFNKY